MRHSMRFVLFFTAAGLLSGCAGLKEDIPKEPRPVRIEISHRVLDASIKDIQALIQQDALDEQQQKRAVEIIAAFKDFKDLPADGGYALSTGIENLIENTSALIQETFADIEPSPAEKTARQDEWSQYHKNIFTAYRAGDHRRVLETAAFLEENYGRDALGPEAGAVLALSLEAEGRTEEALETALLASAELEELPDRLLLAASLARLHALRGKSGEAQKWYRKLEEKLNERTLLLAALEKTLEAMSQKNKDFKAWAMNLRGVRPESDGIVDSIIQAADMAAEENFSDARDILSRARKWIEPTGGDTDLIDEAMRRLEAAEEVYLEKRIKGLSRKDLDLAPISDLLARERYKEALSRLEAVERITGSSTEVNEIRETAIERLITRETTRAAEIFLAAGRQADSKRKRAMLEETRSILRGLLAAYPDAPSADRIESYLDRVEKEIKRLGPGGR